MDIKLPRHAPEEVLYLPGFEVNSFEELYMQKIAQETIYKQHKASFYHIFRYQGNENFHYIKNKKLKLAHNSLLIVNRDTTQQYSTHKCKGDMILFSATFFTNSQEKADFLDQCTLLKNDYIIIPPGTKDFISSVDSYFSLMKIQLKRRTTWEIDKILLRNWLHNLLITIEREYRLQKNRIDPVFDSRDCDYLSQFKDLLDVYYRTEKQVNFYAQKLGLPDRKLSQIVSAAHGISAKEYISEKLLQEAVLLLENSTHNQSEIAIQLGLDFTYFVKFFRKRTGITPAKYRLR